MSEQTITEDEAALYDRQIRLWGLDAQRRLRGCNLLMAGMRGLGAEVTKNIVLAGIKSITLLDHTSVTAEDTTSNFLITRDQIGKNRASSSLQGTKDLNPMVDVLADEDVLSDKTDEFFKKFDVVCVMCQDSKTIKRLNELCIDSRITFFAGDVHGYFGYMFADLGLHEYSVEVPKAEKRRINESGEPETARLQSSEKETVVLKKEEEYTRFTDALQFDWTSKLGVRKLKRAPTAFFLQRVLWEFHSRCKRRPAVSTRKEDLELLYQLRDEVLQKLGLSTDLVSDDMLSLCFGELSPVCAITGGVLAQEIIKAVSQKDPTHNNFFFYNGLEGSGLVDHIG